MVHQVRNPRLGDVSFFATDHIGGYVFALASYAPLDFTSFENRDYERFAGYSAFTQVNRNIASRPDVFIDRFAAHAAAVRTFALANSCDYRQISTAVPYLQVLGGFLVERSG